MNLNRNRILDGARWRPPQRVRKVEVERNGRKRVEEVIEKMPGVRYVQMLNPAGSVVNVPVGNANVRAEDGVTPYKQQILAVKMAKGMLPWGRCPVAMVASQEIPSRLLKNEDLHDASPCVGGGWGPENPCPHALAEQGYRRTRHEEIELAKREDYKAEAEKDREQRERHHEEMIKALAGKKGRATEG